VESIYREQSEGRFVRIGQVNQVNVTYMVAIGTIDEFLSEIVERKREVVKSALDGERPEKWSESNIIKELAEILAEQRGKKWSFQMTIYKCEDCDSNLMRYDIVDNRITILCCVNPLCPQKEIETVYEHKRVN